MDKIKKLGITFWKGLKNAWTKYHFIIPPRLWGNYFKFVWSIVREKNIAEFWFPYDAIGYNAWLDANEKLAAIEKLKYNPLISVLIPVYNVKEEYLRECIESVLSQSYENFEICIVDDASTKKDTLAALKQYEGVDKIRIHHRKKNGHISRATNDALKMAKGEFIALLDNDDTLSPDALYEAAKALNENRKLDLIYSDEDKVAVDGTRCEPHFKPDYSPDTLLSMNYICHLSVIRTDLARKMGGFTVGLEGAQDYDLVLRLTEGTDRIYHIHKILYHWRMIPGSTSVDLDNKQYADDNGKKAIEAALKRRGLYGRVEKDMEVPFYKVIYEFKKEPLVSILIPVKDNASVTKTCLKSIYEKTTYKNFEIILIDNGSKEKKTSELFEKYKNEHSNFRVLREDIEFNYSRLNNLAAKEAKGEYLVLLNNDTEVISPDWLSLLVGYAALPHAGAVGAKLHYPDETLQHAGVVLGMGGGVAAHAFLYASKDDVGVYGRLRVPYDYSAVTAACLCVSKKKFEEVGGLEEKLKVAFNDMDFNLKLLKKGYYNIFVPMVELYHYESKSRGSDMTSANYKRFMGESDYMWEKWGDMLENDRFYNKNFTKRGWFVLDKQPQKQDASNKKWKKGKKDKNILFVAESYESAQYRYRVGNVIEAIEKRSDWGVHAALTIDINDTYLINTNLVVILRQAAKNKTILEFIEKAHRRGVKVLFDLDDLVFDYQDLPKILKGIHTLDVAYWTGFIWGVRRIAKKSDGFVTTNDFLAKRLKRSFGKPVKVIPNSLNDAQLKMADRCLQEKAHDGFVIGYFSGSPTHVRDLRLVESEIFKFLDTHKDAKLKIVGFMEPSKEMKKRIKTGQIELQGFVGYLKQIDLMSKIDVNIAPLVVSEFTNCKSELKFFEAAAVETVTIASPIYTFKNAIIDGENGFLAKPGEWYKKIDHIYNSRKEVEKIAKNARKYALENYHGKKFVEDVEEAYKSFMV